jgi:hypothetical protein
MMLTDQKFTLNRYQEFYADGEYQALLLHD